jgi:quinol-cytochrome oxidoreductase complex cytochrome b subunit
LLVSALVSIGLIAFETTCNLLLLKKQSLSPFILVIYFLTAIFISNRASKKQLTIEKLQKLKTEYAQRRVHPLILFSFMIVLFLILLFIGPFISVLINGGEIFGERINGII